MPADAAAHAATPTRPATVAPVALSRIAEAIGARDHNTAADSAGVVVTGITMDSKDVRPGDLYAAVPGARVHGARFLADVVAAGAVAVLTDVAGAELAGDIAVPLLLVDEPRRSLGTAAATIYDFPASAFALIGVTGTHGKTTTTSLLEAGATACERVPARVGTLGSVVAGRPVPSRLTTPEAPELQGLFAVMRECEVGVCAMEVSSHSLVLGRVDGVRFDLAVFTNLGRDHLDFHDSLEDYYAAKATLFTSERARRALVNVDDEHGRRLAASCELPVRTYSACGLQADWRAEEVVLRGHGATFTVVGPGGSRWPAGVSLPGAFNVANALAAVAALVEVGLPGPCAADGVAQATSVPGRMERIDAGQDFLAVVDYAHKPDAIEAALRAVRELTPGRVLVVLGAGGDRDVGKRPLMGEVAARLADHVVITDDNPRSEEPASIRAAMVDGSRQVPAAQRGLVEEQADRRTAIRRALTQARRGDAVLIAGKGHEQGQELNGTVLAFDDRVVVREVLDELTGRNPR